MLRNRLAAALAVVATLLLVVSAALLVSRWVPYDVGPARTDTWAMVTAFTDLAAVGLGLALVCAVAAVVVRRRRTRVVLAGVCAAAVGAQLLLLAPRWSADPTAAAARPATITVLALNARLGRAEPAALVAAARTADVVVLTEATAPLLRSLREAGLTDRLPWSAGADRLPPRGASGTAVLSRFPVRDAHPLTSDLANQSWVARLDVPGLTAPLTVVAVHPGRPRLGGSSWLGEQEDLRAALPGSGPRLLAGDFNAVSSHPTQRALVGDGWASAVDQAGAGWVPTYPADARRLPPLLDIDHVYVADGIRATRARSVAVAGTDHLGLLVTVVATGAG